MAKKAKSTKKAEPKKKAAKVSGTCGMTPCNQGGRCVQLKVTKCEGHAGPPCADPDCPEWGRW